MRTTKLLTIGAAIIAAGLLVLAATTSNAAFAETNGNNRPTITNSGTATASISQSNSIDDVSCFGGSSVSNSCNPVQSNVNTGNAIAAAAGLVTFGNDDPTATSVADPNNQPNVSNTGEATASITQSNSIDDLKCASFGSVTGSCNPIQSNVNTGTAFALGIGTLDLSGLIR